MRGHAKIYQHFGRQSSRGEYRNNYRDDSYGRSRDRNSSRERSLLRNFSNRRNDRSTSNSRSRCPNLTESLEVPIIKTRSNFKKTLPIALNVSKIDSNLLTASNNLKDFIHQYTCKKEIFDLKGRYDNMALNN